MKLMLGQLAMIGMIWLGMLFFLNELSESARLIFYLVTSWLLFIIVMTLKTYFREKKKKVE